jgi:hypothetical protein
MPRPPGSRRVAMSGDIRDGSSPRPAVRGGRTVVGSCRPISGSPDGGVSTGAAMHGENVPKAVKLEVFAEVMSFPDQLQQEFSRSGLALHALFSSNSNANCLPMTRCSG